MGEYDWRKDLANSDSKATPELIAVLEERGFDGFELSQKANWDIRCVDRSGYPLTIEFKDDMMASKTGNVAIEYMSRGNPSGITVTNSNTWIQKVNNEYLVVLTNRLRNFIIVNYEKYKHKEGGDDNTSKLILIPINHFKNICKDIWKETSKKMEKVS